ncbi:MAG: hypothetical protein A2086_03340 [Spirochaetes bacterium GWD1_27_9]|nr:MAG: hypothetical protein A2Z98_12570 [Spirochaetes bacterium GWB1_27_13]OHD45283.1 MAG: hypothetical protein A2086_03340 [Spirochaetes bacterium GWD1_27_9]
MKNMFKEYLKMMLSKIIGTEKIKVFYSVKDEATYKSPPYISILSKKAIPKKTFLKERKENQTIYLKTYEIVQPIRLVIASTKEEDVENWTEDFFSEIESKHIFTINNIQQYVEIEIVSLEYSDNKSSLSVASAAIDINFIYGTYKNKEVPKIQKIEIKSISIEERLNGSNNE